MKLPKVETLIIMAFFGIVVIWAVSKCNSKRSDFARHTKELSDDKEERPTKRDTVLVPAPQPQQTAPQPVQQSTQPATQPVNTAQPAATPATTPAKPQKLPVLGAPQPQPQPQPQQQTSTPAKSTQPQTDAQKYPTLFVTIDGLKMRKQPNLKGAVVTKLDLYEQVYFLNQKSEKPEEISLGYEKVTDYWVKIRTKSGKEGWVFGAGVHYYKTKRKGVLE